MRVPVSSLKLNLTAIVWYLITSIAGVMLDLFCDGGVAGKHLSADLPGF